MGGAQCVCLHPGGATVAVGYHRGDVRVYDLETGDVWLCFSVVLLLSYFECMFLVSTGPRY